MRDPNRLDSLYETFHMVHKEAFSDWRMFQLLDNFLEWARQKTKCDLFYFEDNKFIELLEEYKKKYGSK